MSPLSPWQMGVGSVLQLYGALCLTAAVLRLLRTAARAWEAEREAQRRAELERRLLRHELAVRVWQEARAGRAGRAGQATVLGEEE